MKPIKKLSSSYCPNCAGVKLASKDSRAHFAFGFPTTKRRKVCPSCDFRVTTIELPLHLAEEIFQEN
jgi:transcriptional regulator NrdR family protein